MFKNTEVSAVVYDIEPSRDDEYNVPIGLALCGQNSENENGIVILLARHGHHTYLVNAYLESLSDEQRSNVSDFYSSDVAAVGFFSRTDRDPGVQFMDRDDRDDSRLDRELAAKALYATLKSNAHVLLPDDGVIRQMEIPQEELDAAVVQGLD